MPDPTVVHATHWKAGSQWVRQVLLAAAPRRVVSPQGGMSHVTEAPIVPGGIYTPVYLRRDRLMEAFARTGDARMFLVVRDPRDVLVSWYFSLRYSHPSNDWVADFRSKVEGLDDEGGMLEMLRRSLWSIFEIQQGWLGLPDVPVFRYEDIIEDEHAAFEAILKYCEIDIDEGRRRSIVEQASFRNVTGRERGVESINHHHRKAVAGDWRNYFTDRIKDEFKATFGHQLIKVGYATDHDW